MARLKTLSACALSLALIPSPTVLAQDSGGYPSGGVGSAAGMARSGAASVIDIDFAGGNLSEYFEHLQMKNGVRNIIVGSEDLAQVSMPRVQLTGVLFSDAVELPYFLAQSPDGQQISIDTVGSSKSIFVVGMRDLGEVGWIDPVHKPISFEFDGGSLAEFVDVVQAAAGTKQVLVRGNAAEFEMPPLQMEKVTLYGVLSALDGDERRHRNGDRSRLNVGDRDGVYLVEVETDSPSRQDMEARRTQTMSWSVASLRGQGSVSTEELLTAIEAAVEVSEGVETTKLRFHDETSLLIVSATGQTLQMIDSVLQQLSRSANSTATARQEALEQQSKFRSEAMIARSRMDYFTELLNFEEKRLERLQASFESGSISEEEVHEQRLAVLEARASGQEAEARLQEVEARLAQVQSRLDAME